MAKQTRAQHEADDNPKAEETGDKPSLDESIEHVCSELEAARSAPKKMAAAKGGAATDGLIDELILPFILAGLKWWREHRNK
jgi:hypothetical protein